MRVGPVFFVFLLLCTDADAQGFALCRRPSLAAAVDAAMKADQQCLDAAAKRLALSPDPPTGVAAAAAGVCVDETDRLALATLQCRPQANYLRLLDLFQNAAHDRAQSQVEQARSAEARAGLQP